MTERSKAIKSLIPSEPAKRVKATRSDCNCEPKTEDPRIVKLSDLSPGEACSAAPDAETIKRVMNTAIISGLVVTTTLDYGARDYIPQYMRRQAWLATHFRHPAIILIQEARAPEAKTP